MPWNKKLGVGGYNTAYLSNDGRKVLKVQLAELKGTINASYDTPERSVRLWNELNPNLKPPAYIENSEHGIGWVCPFVKGEQASDDEVAEVVRNVFNSSGRVITDAIGSKNVIKTDDGQLVCVDIGMALQLDKRDEVFFAEGRKRSKSTISLVAWANLKNNYPPYFNHPSCQRNFPNSIQTIKALLFIKENRPDIFNVDFLKNDPALVKTLADAYYNGKVFEQAKTQLDTASAMAIEKERLATVVSDAHGALSKERPIDFQNIKESCVRQLELYIESRGSINKKSIFEPSLMTKIFRDDALTLKKVSNAKDLILKIKGNIDLKELDYLIKRAHVDPELTKSKFSSGFKVTLGKCMLSVQLAQTHGSKNEKVMTLV